jgi:hypothetical protein
MAATLSGDIADFVAGTLKDLGPLKFAQIAQTLQSYPVLGKWLKKDRLTFDNGNGIQRNLMSKLSNQASHVGLLDTDTYDIPDLMVQLNVPWKHAQTKWGFIYQTDILMNSGRSAVFKVVEPRRLDALISLAEELEAKAWSAPNLADTTEPYGVPFWVVANATTGFNGGLPGDHTTVAGVNLVDHPNFKNYTARYTNVTKPDLIKKMRTGMRKMSWQSPVSHADYRSGSGQKMQLYTNETTVASLEDLGEAQNENLGRDLASVEAGAGKDIGTVDMQLVFRRHPIFWVPQLDDTAVFTAATNPIYCIDHSTFYPVVLKGDYLREGDAKEVPNQHNVYRIFVDLSYNYMCLDRRRNAIFATA